LRSSIPIRRAPAPEFSLTARAYEHIRDAILGAQLLPGTPISTRRLAEQLGVSTLPVSKALLRLESEGFVESRPKAGTRVKIPTPAEIRGTYILREALETQAARLFTETATASQRKTLLRKAAALDHAFDRLDPAEPGSTERHERTEREHVDFHIFVATVIQCPQLKEAIERSRVLLFNWLFMTSGRFHRLPPLWHAELAAQLAGTNPHAAAEAMRRHVRYRMDEVIERFQGFSAEALSTRITRGPQKRTVEKIAASRAV